MTPDVVVDIGNSRIKWGRCEDGRITEFAALGFDPPEPWNEQRKSWNLTPRTRWVLASVNPTVRDRFAAWLQTTGGELTVLADYRQVPLRVAVEQPTQLGIDRLLTAFAARRLADRRPVIVFNIGTAMTADLVDGAGTFLGGAILPGPQLMARSLHEHTAKLPLIDAGDLHTVGCPGRDTRRAIGLGIASAVGGATSRLIESYSRLLESPPVVFFTGGGMGPLTDLDPDEMWTPDPDDTRFVPTLTLEGIRLAAEQLP